MTVQTNVQHYTNDDIRRMKELINEGCIVLQEMEDLKEGLSDTVKAIAEEISVKPAQLNKAIKICCKNSLAEEQEKFDEVLDIIQAAGRG